MNSRKIENFKMVFIHELGHFVTNEILFEKFGIYEPTDLSIDWIANKARFVGQHRRKNRTDIKLKGIYNGAHLYDLEGSITVLFGCIFQTIYAIP